MKIDRRILTFPILVIALLGAIPVCGATADEVAVAKNLEAFRAAQFVGDARALAALCAEELSYSHADGRIEDKATFLSGVINRKAKLLKLLYDDPRIRIVGNAAIVRFYYISDSEAIADGTRSSNRLLILMNWQKQGAEWKLLSRASTKL